MTEFWHCQSQNFRELERSTEVGVIRMSSQMGPYNQHPLMHDLNLTNVGGTPLLRRQENTQHDVCPASACGICKPVLPGDNGQLPGPIQAQKYGQHSQDHPHALTNDRCTRDIFQTLIATTFVRVTFKHNLLHHTNEAFALGRRHLHWLVQSILRNPPGKMPIPACNDRFFAALLGRMGGTRSTDSDTTHLAPGCHRRQLLARLTSATR
mmetsp:Transcript_7422/g.17589  ORF Transcript_7422/g.17589 Transcript_7422/m.17589 type:complete len:209 (-) Transcript_7422:1374-2000(-)